MCIQVTERYVICRCIYQKYRIEIDTCPSYRRKGHTVQKREILVGYSCSIHSSSSVYQPDRLQPRHKRYTASSIRLPEFDAAESIKHSTAHEPSPSSLRGQDQALLRNLQTQFAATKVWGDWHSHREMYRSHTANLFGNSIANQCAN